MGSAQYDTVSVETNSDGDATAYTGVRRGKIINVIYAKDGSSPYADGVDFTITTEDTGQTVWDEDNVNASKTVAPRQATHSTVGVASLYAADGEPVEDHVHMCGERLKIVVANGGDTKTGAFTLIVE
jgi:hypothetical protein